MNRSVSIDIIKAVSIFGVVFIHTLNLFHFSSFYSSLISDFFRFAVPYFIIIWAYFFERSYSKKNKTERLDYLVNRFKHLFIIYLVWSVIYICVYANLESLTLINLITMYLTGYGWSGQYYFIILFQLIILFPVIRKLMEYKTLAYIILFCIALMVLFYSYNLVPIPVVALKLSDRPFIFWLPYTFAGIALARNTFLKMPAFVLFLLLLIPLEALLFKTNSEYVRVSVYCASILSCAYLIQNPIFISNSFMTKIITFVGENTMIIFVSNPLIIFFIGKLNVGLWNVQSFQCGIVFILVVVVINIALFIKYILKKAGIQSIFF